MKSLSEQIQQFHFPRWEELPEFDLYMDQVVNLVDKYLATFASQEEEGKIITPTMINNYVKQKMIRPPVLKKYDRPQLAFFLVVSILKRILSMNEITEMTSIVLSVLEPDKAYNRFCAELENALQITFHPQYSANVPFSIELSNTAEAEYEIIAVRAMALAFANKIYAQKVIELRKSQEKQS